MIEVGILGAAALFVAGLVTGLALRRGPARPPSGPESPEESLARLSGSGRGTAFPKGSGFAPGLQPKVRPGVSPPAPRGGGMVLPKRARVIRFDR